MNRIILLVFLFFINHQFVLAQIELGVKAGANASRSVFDDEIYNRLNDSKYKPAYVVGIVAVFNHSENDKYALQTELTYAKIGRKVESTNEPGITVNKANYSYLQLPVMFRVRFKQPSFSWFVQLGPQINYWIGGKGTYGEFDTNRQLINEYEYSINFGEPINEFGYMNMKDFNRFQIGLSVGAGVMREFNEADRVIIGIRYYFGHSYMGVEEGGEIPNTAFMDNFESTNQILELSVAYTFDLYEKIKIIRKNMQ